MNYSIYIFFNILFKGIKQIQFDFEKNKLSRLDAFLRPTLF